MRSGGRIGLGVAAAFLAIGAPSGAHQSARAASAPTVRALAASAAETPSAQRSSLAFVLQDDALLLYHPDELGRNLDEIAGLGFTHLRINANWNTLTRASGAARRPAFDARDPAAYDQRRWLALDRVVRAASARGLTVMIDIAFFAPRWATRGTPAGDPRPRNEVDPDAFTDFAVAVARRYRGDFVPPGSHAALPSVGIFTLWNEPNLPVFWRPQRRVRADGQVELSSPHAYRRLSNQAYVAIKTLRPDTKILIGGLASGPAWNPRLKQAGIPAMRFLREMACVDALLRPLHTPACRSFRGVFGDGLAVHPYSFGYAPEHRPVGARADNLTTGNLDYLAWLTRQLVARGRFAGGLGDLYVTEFGYLTGVPGPGVRPLENPFPKVTLRRQAGWLTWGHYLAWRIPQVKMFAQFLMRDTLCAPDAPAECIDWTSGLRFANGIEKPALRALEGALHVRVLPDHNVLAWIRLGTPQARRDAVLAYQPPDRRSLEPVDENYVIDASGGGPDGIFSLKLRPPPGQLRLVF